MTPPRPYQVRVVVAACALALLAFACSDDSGTSPPRVGPAGDLAALVEKGHGVRHHAVYQQSTGERLEIWVDGDRVKVSACPDASGSSCTETSGSNGDPGAQVDQLLGDVSATDVSSRSDTIAGLAVRCFGLQAPEGPVEICLTDAGMLARLSLADDKLELVSIDNDVDESVFDVESS